MELMIVMGVLGALVLTLLSMAVHIVPQSKEIVVERLGRFHKTMTGGFHLTIPFVDQKRQAFSLQQQILDIPPQRVITKDNITLKIDGIVYMRVHDAKKACYEVDDLKSAIGQLAQTTLRSEIGRMELDDTLSSRAQLNQALLDSLDEASDEWGTKVVRVEIKNLETPQEVEEAMRLHMTAVRKRRAEEETAEGEANAEKTRAQGAALAAKSTAQGELDAERLRAEGIVATAEARKQERILLAEAKAQEDKLAGEGEKAKLREIAEGLKDAPGAAEFLLAQGRVQAWNGIAASDSGNKVIVPFESSELIGSMSLLGEFFKKDSKPSKGAANEPRKSNIA